MAGVLFITGFNRSGTTLITSAVTQAARARTLTVGDLARHMPSVRRFLTAAGKHGTVTDRGVDRLPVSESLGPRVTALVSERLRSRVLMSFLLSWHRGVLTRAVPA